MDGQGDHPGETPQADPDDDDQAPDDRIDGAHHIQNGARNVIDDCSARET